MVCQGFVERKHSDRNSVTSVACLLVLPVDDRRYRGNLGDVAFPSPFGGIGAFGRTPVIPVIFERDAVMRLSHAG